MHGGKLLSADVVIFGVSTISEDGNISVDLEAADVAKGVPICRETQVQKADLDIGNTEKIFEALQKVAIPLSTQFYACIVQGMEVKKEAVEQFEIRLAGLRTYQAIHGVQGFSPQCRTRSNRCNAEQNSRKLHYRFHPVYGWQRKITGRSVESCKTSLPPSFEPVRRRNNDPEPGMKDTMTVPNLITTIRIILAPIFIIYLLDDRFLAALSVFVIAGVSDGADGLIARVFNQKSRLGAFLDPLADKILLVAAFVVLAVRGYIPSWLAVIVITRDVLILLGVLILFLSRGHLNIRPSIISKITTCLQLGTVFLVLVRNHFHLFSEYMLPMYWLTGIMTIVSGLHYIRSWFLMMGEENDRG